MPKSQAIFKPRLRTTSPRHPEEFMTLSCQMPSTSTHLTNLGLRIQATVACSFVTTHMRQRKRLQRTRPRISLVLTPKFCHGRAPNLRALSQSCSLGTTGQTRSDLSAPLQCQPEIRITLGSSAANFRTMLKSRRSTHSTRRTVKFTCSRVLEASGRKVKEKSGNYWQKT